MAAPRVPMFEARILMGREVWKERRCGRGQCSTHLKEGRTLPALGRRQMRSRFLDNFHNMDVLGGTRVSD